MPVIPDFDPQTATEDDVIAYMKAAGEHLAVVQRNREICEERIARGDKVFPMCRCSGCDELLPVRDDLTAECPTHGVLPAPNPN